MEQLVHPVDTRISTTDIVCKCIRVCTLILNQSICIVLGAHHFWYIICIRETETCIECYLCCACLTCLGLYHDNTIGTAGTIDGGRRCVLQYLDALDIFRADTFKTCLANDTVYYVEGGVALVYGTGTTYTDFHGSTRNTTRHYLHTRHTSVEGILNTCNRLVLEILAVQNCHRTCQVGLLYCTVTDDYGLFKHVGIILQSDVERTTAPCEGL